MALGLAAASANSILDAYCRGNSYPGNAAFWIKLYIGDPGAAGTSNAAGNTTRQQSTFGSSPSGGSVANTAALTWTSVSNSETYTDIAAFTASTAGTFLGSGTMTANAVTIGDTFVIPIGSLTVSFPVAA
jgi:hypothetical protein